VWVYVGSLVSSGSIAQLFSSIFFWNRARYEVEVFAGWMLSPSPNWWYSKIQMLTETSRHLLTCLLLFSGCQLPGLFDGCSFYFHGEFCQPTPPREDLVQLVTLGGGAVLHREPTVDMVNQSAVTVPYHAHMTSSLANCSHYVVSADERDVTAVTGDRLCRVPPSWITTCIAQFQLVDRLSS